MMTNTDQRSKLDRRRERAQATKVAAKAAQQRLHRVDDQLAANAAQTREHEAALRTASDEVARRKKALKAAAQNKKRLTANRKKAAGAATRAEQKSTAAEGKYDAAVLADLVRRERDRDLAAHGGAEKTPVAGASAPAPDKPASVARDTAARKTAATAADPANQ
jgi:chromosome segregation ATPase